MIFEPYRSFRQYIILINFPVLSFKELNFIRYHSILGCILLMKRIQEKIHRRYQEILKLCNIPRILTKYRIERTHFSKALKLLFKYLPKNETF
jgi:hypothetical protein